MKTLHRLIVGAMASSVVLLLNGATVRGMAQTQPPAKMHRHAEGRRAMPAGSHQALLMAFRDNLATFARAVQRQATLAKAVDLDLARPAAVEMRRSFGQIQLHNQAQAATMSDQVKQQMETRLAALNEHLTALESELNGSTPDPKKVAAQATEVLHQCAGVSLPAQAKTLN